MNPSRILGSPVFFAALVAAAPAFAGTLYVDASATTGANDGSSWANAFQGPSGMSSALAAAVSGDEIWVADGTYLPTLSGIRTFSFDLKSGVELYGGFAGGESSLSQRDPSLHAAVLSGDLAGDDSGGNYADNSYHVVKASSVGSGALLDGFRIRGGNADGASSPAFDDCGGALWMVDSNVPILRCVLEGNRCAATGGAVFVIKLAGGTVTRFEDCRFAGNQAGSGGGAVQLSASGDTARFDRCVFTGNSAPEGSAVHLYLAFDVFFRDSLFHGNTATGSGGAAIRAIGESYPWLIGCTVAGNSSLAAAPAGLSASAETWIWNSILYFNTGPGGAQGTANQVSAGSPIAEYSCVQGGLAGTAMLAADPSFVDLAGGNFRLAPTSPCVDRANNTRADALDVERTPRLEDLTTVADGGSGTAPIADLGAFESPGSLYEPFCPGDGSLATACPCGNVGDDGRGCRHSVSNSTGALLAAAGAAHPDTVQLTVSGVRTGVLCIFLQGNAPIPSGVVFGDGVRCVGGALKRIGSKNASSGGIAFYPGAGDPSVSGRSAALGDPIPSGGERWYQTWYRDNSTTFCPSPAGSVSNVSSGLIVSW